MGYIGSIVSNFYLNKNFEVYVVDDLIYKQNYVLNSFILNKRFFFYKLSINDYDEIKKIILNNKIEKIVVLSGLVGDPITKKYPKLSKIYNEKNILTFLKKINFFYKGKLIFISTCSNYGLSNDDNYLDEKSPLKPLSLYAKSKVKIERYIITTKTNYTASILRFATAFGASFRMRYDLTVNEFIKDLYLGRKVEVYDFETWRPYCHVSDFAKIIFKTLELDKNISHKLILNCGSNKNNFNKHDLIKRISAKIPKGSYKFIKKSKDKRNYKVSFDKINQIFGNLNFKSLDYGIEEILELLNKDINKSRIDNGNYEIK